MNRNRLSTVLTFDPIVSAQLGVEIFTLGLRTLISKAKSPIQTSESLHSNESNRKLVEHDLVGSHSH
jgi:hypothetical protein